MNAGYAEQAKRAIEKVFDDPAQQQLAERIDEVLDLLDTDPGHQRLRKQRMQTPKYWAVLLHGPERDFLILWDFTDAGQPWVHYAGDGF